MKQRIKFSTFSLIITVGVLILFTVGIFSLRGNVEKLAVFCMILGTITLFGIYFCPKTIEANESGITLHRLLSPAKFFSYKTIQSVDNCYPSLGGLRLCASGGFFGYWGYFKDMVIGTYFGYYGSQSNCILVKLKDGKQYVLGCDDSSALISYINSHLL